ncbi:MAG: protein kinase [Isosphaeraceae bacterium]|nr:protein kinase [Isosphaeraceae bacterium]
MADFDAETLVEQACLLGLVTREDARTAMAEAENGSIEAITRSFLRKGLLTSWQLDRLMKGDPSGFFYGGYKILFHLAEGTFARVYRGQRVEGGAPVAVKVLRQRFVADPAAVERFNKEAEAGMRLRHANIVQILDYGEQDRRHFMVMEYVEGQNLRDFLKLRVRLDAKTALPLMLGLAHGLQYSIASGVTHRDIKGTNILIANNGAAKLVDFGLATIEGDDKKTTMQSQRTVDYSALERMCGSQKGDPRSDVYFLGCVFYQMLTGQLPMPEVESKDMLAKMLKRSFGAIKPLSEHTYAPDPALSAIVEKMMKMDLKARYQTMDEVVADLEAYDARQKSPQLAVAAEDEDDISGEIFVTRVEEAKPEPDAFDPVSFETKAFVHKNVLCVEAQGEIQDAFRKTLSKMGYRVLLVSNAELGAERFREQTPDAVIFDTDGLGPDALDAFIDMHDKAHEDGHSLAALVILGPKQRALREKLPTDDRLVVLDKPIKMKQVQDAIVELVPVG